MLAFHRAAQNLGDAAPGEDEKINPYKISLDPDRWEADGLLDAERDVAGRGASDRRVGPGEPVHRGGRAAGVIVVSALTKSSSWSVRQHSNASQCCS